MLRRTSKAKDMEARKRARKEIFECPSTCVVCLSAASGYHYDAPSCSSCKTFFRRSVLDQRVYSQCRKDGNCTTNESIRKCRACRFDRCVSGGMNPLFIDSLKDAESNPVVLRIFAKRAVSREESQDASSRISMSTLSRVSVVECKMDRLIAGLLHLESAHQRLRASSCAPSPRDGYRLDSLITSRSLLSGSFQEPQFSWGEPIPCSPKAEQPTNPKPTKLWPYADLFFSIEYMKTFEFFHYLAHEDKKALVRHVSIMCTHLTSAFFSYEKQSGVTVTPDGWMPHNGFVAPELTHERQLHHGNIQQLRELRLDKKEYVLLKALIVCNPAIEGLSTSHKSELDKARLMYSSSLMSYVLSRRGFVEGPSAFAAMMAMVDMLTHLMKRHKNWFVLTQAMSHKQGIIKEPSLFDDILFY